MKCRTCGADLASQGKNKKARYCNTQCANKFYYTYTPIPKEDRKIREHRYDLSKTEQKRRSEIWASYKLDWEDYLNLYDQQHRRCAICKVDIFHLSQGTNFVKSRMACVDHCHTTGKVRGLLCAECNKGLGNFKDNPVSLRNALEYLENPPCA